MNPGEVDSVEDAIRELNDGRGVAKSLETSGASTAAQAALQVLDLWGTACWVGIGSTIGFELTEHLYKQVTGMTSWTLSIPAMAECAAFLVEREIDVDSLYTDRWTLGTPSRHIVTLISRARERAFFSPSECARPSSPRAGTYRALMMSSTRSLASPKSIWLLSRKNSGFCTPA